VATAGSSSTEEMRIADYLAEGHGKAD